MRHSEQLFGPGRGNLNKNYPKIQIPGGLPGELLKLRSYIHKSTKKKCNL